MAMRVLLVALCLAACGATVDKYDGAHRSCCSEHATSGCDDVEVKQCVCDIDASCCDANGAGWDKNCVNQVTYHHCGVCKQDMSLVMTKVGSVPDTASGKVIDQDKAPAADEKSKAAAKTAETAGKAATAAHSAAAAAKPATGAAAGAAAGAHGDCDKAHKKGGCANKKLAACVCKHDSWCCDIEWDSHCVKQAAKKDICSAAAPKDANVRAKAATAKVAAVEKGEKKKHQVDAGKDAASSAKAESAEAESAAAEAEPKEKVAAAAMPEPENAEDKVKAVAKAAEDAVSKSEPVTAPVKDADGKAKAVNASQASPKDMIEAASNEVPKSEGKKAAPAGKNGHHCFKPGNCTHKPTLECACQHDSTCCDDEWDWDTLCSNVANYLCHHEADQAVPKSAKKAAEKMKMAKKIAHEATHLDAPAQDAMVTLDMDFAFVQKDLKTFKKAFSSDVGASLDIPAAEVHVTEVLPGSIKVKFTVPTAEKFALLEKKGMQNLPALGKVAGKPVAATGITAMDHVDAEDKPKVQKKAAAAPATNEEEDESTGSGSSEGDKVEDKEDPDVKDPVDEPAADVVVAPEPPAEDPKEMMRKTMLAAQRKKANEVAGRLEKAMASKESRDAAKHLAAKEKATLIRHRVAHEAMSKAKAAHLNGVHESEATPKQLSAVTKSFAAKYTAGMKNTVQLLKAKAAKEANKGRLEEALKLVESPVVTENLLKDNFHTGTDYLVKHVISPREPSEVDDMENKQALEKAREGIASLRMTPLQVDLTGIKAIKLMVMSTLNASKLADKMMTPSERDLAMSKMVIKQLEGNDKTAAGNNTAENAFAIKMFNATAKAGNPDSHGFNVSKGDAGVKGKGDELARAKAALKRIASGNYTVSEKMMSNEVDAAAAAQEMDDKEKMQLMAEKLNKASAAADGYAGPGVILMTVSGAVDTPAFRVAFKNDVAAAVTCKETRVKVDAIRSGMVLMYFTGNKNDSKLSTGPALKDDLIDALEDKKLAFPSVEKLFNSPIVAALPIADAIQHFNKTNLTAAGLGESTGRTLAKVVGILKAPKAVASKKKVAAAKKAAAATHARATAVADALAAGKSQEEADAAGEAASQSAASPKAADAIKKAKANVAAALAAGTTPDPADVAASQSASSEDEEEETGEIDDKAPSTDSPAGNASSPVNSKMASILAKLTQIPGLAASGVNMTEIAEAEAEAQAADPSLKQAENGTANGTADAGNSSDADSSTSAAGKPSSSASSSVKAALLKLGVDSSNDAVASTVVSMTISMDYDWVAANTAEFKKVFAKDIAATLSIDTARCDVQSVKSGSTVVKFALLSAVSNETAEGSAEPSSSQLAETLVHMGEGVEFPNLSRQSGVDMQSLKAKAIDWKVMETTDPADQAAAATDAIAAKIGSMVNTGAAAKAAEAPAGGVKVSDTVDKLASSGGATKMNGAVSNLQKEQGVRESNSLAELNSVLATQGNSSGFNLTEALNASTSEAMNGSAIASADVFLETGKSASVRRTLGRIFASLSSMSKK